MRNRDSVSPLVEGMDFECGGESLVYVRSEKVLVSPRGAAACVPIKNFLKGRIWRGVFRGSD